MNEYPYINSTADGKLTHQKILQSFLLWFVEDKNTINATINASLEPGVNVFEVTEEVKDNIKETIKKVVGLEVKNIEMYFKKIKNNSKEK